MLPAMADTTNLKDILKDQPPTKTRQYVDPQPGKYADDAAFGFILLSGAAFFASLMSLALDRDGDSAVFFVLVATYLVLLYIALDPRR